MVKLRWLSAQCLFWSTRWYGRHGCTPLAWSRRCETKAYSVSFEGQLFSFLRKSSRVGVAGLFSCVFVGPLAFFGVLFHWQRVRAKLPHRQLSFVDKLCIAQHDEEMKREGILGLAAFLKHSRRLVVLWSPTYFSRLWCTYELATWFRYNRPLSSILFMPVEIPFVLVCGVAFLIPHFGWRHISLTFELTAPPIFVMLVFIEHVLASYVLLGHVEHVTKLRHDLDNFSVQRSECFCCSNDHQHPESGLPMLCDREFVYETLRQSFRSSGLEGQQDEHLATFNHEVKTTLNHYVVSALPECRLFIRYADVLFMGFPIPCYVIEECIFHYRLGHTQLWMYFLSGLAVWLLVFPLEINILLRAIYAVHGRAVGRTRSRKRKLFLASFVWAPIAGFLVAFFWKFVNEEAWIRNDMVWPFFVAVMAETLLASCLFGRLPRMQAASLFRGCAATLSHPPSRVGRSGSVTAHNGGVQTVGAAARGAIGPMDGCASGHRLKPSSAAPNCL
eukprot:TRINITY_DN4935_c0_g4_i1.p1 TRINITY_DN4935_c0_g4~~TRINITY_DN4935_c0_g4_i1.p1  ORF type:complete len:502 (-),score=16.76 TRINITY_DN4935_c0_g4_i1:224-1729(-)